MKNVCLTIKSHCTASTTSGVKSFTEDQSRTSSFTFATPGVISTSFHQCLLSSTVNIFATFARSVLIAQGITLVKLPARCAVDLIAIHSDISSANTVIHSATIKLVFECMKKSFVIKSVTVTIVATANLEITSVVPNNDGVIIVANPLNFPTSVIFKNN